ncbi:MAG: endonuclease III [Elusimicrobia bacterium]|nr:endonuclease III [Elusimicrobiota bacterium]
MGSRRKPLAGVAFDRQRQARRVLRGLRRLYPDAHCELDFSTPLELIVATILSAQCTDKRVNQVTPGLFKRYRTAADYAAADPAALEQEIRTTGFFRSKAASLRAMAATLVARFGGRVPRTMDELLELRGVARKTANVVLGTAYGIPSGVVVDTHMRRVAYRLGLTDEKDPGKIERDLQAVVPRRAWIFFGHAMIWHGRRVCRAAAPDCPGCLLKTFCPKRGV